MMTQRRRSFLPFIPFLMLVALVVAGLPALSGAQPACPPDGDVDKSGSVTAEDALLVFQHTLGLTQLSACQQVIADVFPQPAAPDGSITASDALCIFQEALSLPSCLDILPPSNQPPVVDAGVDQSVSAGTMVLLSGTASDPDGTIVSYLWEQMGGTMVALSGATDATAMFAAPDVLADETLAFRLTVADDDGAQASASVQVVVRRVNQVPVVNSVPDQSVYAGAAVTLTLRASDLDGSVVSYLWEQTDGAVVSLLGAAGPSAVFRAPSVTVDEVLTFRVTVTDDGGATASDEVKVRVTTAGMAADGFSSVSAGGRHTCAIRRTGEVVCWGYNEHGESVAPTGTFISVSAGYQHTCGVRDTGEMACWGDDSLGQSTPPAGTFASVSAKWSETCGLRDTGEAVCWGQTSGSPEGVFVSVAAGSRWYFCGVRVTGEVDCTVSDYFGSHPPPFGVFTSVSGGACGIRDTGEVACWGDVSLTTPPAGTFTSVSVGQGGYACGVRDTGEVMCWGSHNSHGQMNPPLGTFTSVSVGAEHTCGIRDTGAVECWGHDRWGQSRPFLGTFTSVSAAYPHVCGVRDTSEVACRGDDNYGETMPPAGRFTSVSAGPSYTCGVRDTGEVACWGDDPLGQSTPPAGTFVSVSAGGQYACGLRDTGAVECWGVWSSYDYSPLGTTFTSVSGGYFSCGIRDTGRIVCWGARFHGDWNWDYMISRGGQTCGVRYGEEEERCWDYDEQGRSVPPAGTFASLSYDGSRTYCAVRDTGEAVCWVRERYREPYSFAVATPPAGAFTSVSAGVYWACGLRETGEVACWGEEDWGVPGPVPLGKFTSVSAGQQDYACAIRETGEVACWGQYMTYGLKESDF